MTNKAGSFIGNKEFFWKHRFMIAKPTQRTAAKRRVSAAASCRDRSSTVAWLEFHRRYMHLPHGSNRLWTGIGMGSSSGTARGTHHVFLTFSMEAAAAALAKGDLVLAGAALHKSD